MPNLAAADALAYGADPVDAAFYGAVDLGVGGGSSKNILSYEEATFEGVSVPASVDDFWGDGLVFAMSAEQAAHGSQSLKVTAPYDSIYLEFDLGVIDVDPSTQYTAVCEFYSSVAGLQCGISIIWLQANGTTGATGGPSVGGDTALTQNTWSQRTVTGTSGANAAKAHLRIDINQMDTGEVFYLDKCGLWLGATTDWEAP